MNDKRAKQLRRVARIECGNNRATTYLQHRQRGQIIVAPACERGIYLFLKRNEGRV